MSPSCALRVAEAYTDTTTTGTHEPESRRRDHRQRQLLSDVPASIREQADIESGDKIRWTVDDDGTVSIEIVKQRVGVFDDFEPASMGGDGTTAHDKTGAER